MFIDVDYNKRPKKAKIELAKPNKRIVSNISEKIEDTANLKLGNINELNFSIPHEIDGEHNKHIDLIKEKMLVRLTLGAYKEWYIVDEIVEDGDDKDIFNVKAFSLGYELKGKRVAFIEEGAINAKDLLTELLKPSIWKIGEIAPIFNEMHRSFTLENSNVLDGILQAGETYGALIVWDTATRKISFLDMKNNGKFKGMTVDYGRFLKTISRTRTTDEMVTRLFIYGEEDLSIYSSNPTGEPYLEDFSYFMFPFQRDGNRRVIESSYFMSDELCHALLDHEQVVADNAPQITALLNSRHTLSIQQITVESQLDEMELELENILELLDMAQAVGTEEAIVLRKSERDSKLAEIQSSQSILNTLNSQIEVLDGQIEGLQNGIADDPRFTDELLDELNLFVIEGEWRDDRYTDAQELYLDGLEKFKEMRKPKVVIEADIDSLLDVVEEQYYWDKLVLGDLIKVKYPQMKIEYMAKIIEINYNLSEGTASLVIANTSDLLSDQEKLIQLLYSNQSASSLVQNSKYKWDKINSISKEVNAILTQEWDANKNKITAGVNNTIEIGNRGIIIRSPDYPNEVIIIQSGIIALSRDGGDTWKTAIKPDGIVAERLIGKVIAGQDLFITNNSGTFIMDDSGVEIDASSFIIRSGSKNQVVNLVDVWNGTTDFVEELVSDNILTPYEKRQLKPQWERIKAVYDSMVIRLNGYYEDQGANIPAVSILHQRYLELYNYLFTELQVDGHEILNEANMSQSTRVDGVVFDKKFKDFDTYRVKVDELISLRAKDLAIEAKAVADDARDNIKELEDDIVWKIEIHSSKGFTFKNGIIDTVITARVYRGMDDVTLTVPNTGFIWKKYDKNGVIDTAWNTAHVGVGNVVSVTSEDVQVKAIFSCDVDITK